MSRALLVAVACVAIVACGGSDGSPADRFDIPFTLGDGTGTQDTGAPDADAPGDAGDEREDDLAATDAADEAPSVEVEPDVPPADPGEDEAGPADIVPDEAVATEVDVADADADLADADTADPSDVPCTVGGCPAGKTCSNGQCMDCFFNFACGPSCADCTKTATPLCFEGACVECRVPSDCYGKGWCKDNACVPCPDDDPDHCGAECAKCEGTTPVCLLGACACTGSSCGTEYCLDGRCSACDTDGACGPSCLPCAPETPRCVAKTCVECTLDTDCADGEWCDANACVPCGDDPGHCGPACVGCPLNAPSCVAGACQCTPTSCGTGSQCVGGGCVGCTTPAACGPSCMECGAGAPYCFQGDHCAQCQAATAATDCPAGWACGSDGMCVDPCAGTPGCVTDTSSTNGTKCSTAWVLGRTSISQAGGLNVSGDTTGRKNDDDTPSFGGPDCWDANEDDAYKVWMFAGDVLKVNGIPLSSTFTMSLKLYRGTSCASNWKADLITCQWKAGDGKPESYTYTATQDGWVSIVVDGASAFDEEEDWGPYTLNAQLTCGGNKCCCQ